MHKNPKLKKIRTAVPSETDIYRSILYPPFLNWNHQISENHVAFVVSSSINQ